MKAPGRRFQQSAHKQNPYAISSDKYLSDAEFTALQAHLHVQKSFNLRDTSLLLTALLTGARASEVLNIRSKDLIAADRSVRILGLKNSYNRDVPVPDWLFEDLTKLSETSTGPFIFNIGYQRLHQIWVSYRQTHKNFHSLRHTFAIRLYKRTRDLHLVQKALGHKNIKNTLVYLHYVSSKEEMRRVLDPEMIR